VRGSSDRWNEQNNSSCSEFGFP